MESAAKIRRKVLRDGRSIKLVSRETGLPWNTSRKYLKDGSPPSCQRQGDPIRHKVCDFEGRLRDLYETNRYCKGIFFANKFGRGGRNGGVIGMDRLRPLKT